MKYRVRDLIDGYDYELSSNRSYYQLTFPMNAGILSVVIGNVEIVDVVNIADSIARFARIKQNSNGPRREEQYLMNGLTEAARIR